MPPAGLEYADDTLILLCGDLHNLNSLKQILDDFATATGLVINYHKSMFIPMNLESTVAADMAGVFSCPISTFPQPYMGLPLSSGKHHNVDFLPLIAKCDKYLAGWKGRLLSKGGRLTLTNAVLSSVPVYHMCSLPLPKGVIAAIDRRRRTFLCTGEEKCSGSSCQIAWEQACLPRDKGGLGIEDLATQNKCLLLKFAYKFFAAYSVPWITWLRSQSTVLHRFTGDSFLPTLLSSIHQTY